MKNAHFVRNNRYLKYISLTAALFCVICLLPLNANAADNVLYPITDKYQSIDNSDHSTTNDFSVQSFSYGSRTIGRVSLTGSVGMQSMFNGYPAYSINDSLIIGLDYDGGYQSGIKEEWNLVSDSSKSVAGFELKKKIDKGTIIIRKSSDGRIWENVIEPIQNVFTAKKLERSNLYAVPEADLKSGTYYQIILAYELQQKTGENERWWLIPDEELYRHAFCTEVYQFYACYSFSSVSFRDIVTGNELSTGASVVSGFVVDKNNSTDTVTIQMEGKQEVSVDTLSSVIEKGNYTIRVTTPLGQQYVYSIRVTEGLNASKLSPFVYENEKKDKYTESNLLVGRTAFGENSHTALSICHDSEAQIIRSTFNGIPAFGVLGKQVSLLLRINDIADNSWHIESDTWGKKDSELISGAHVGQVNTGALIIQTSSDGKTWTNEELSRYAKGLYTTDFENYYGHRGDILIYQPNGNAVLNGLFIRVLYAYEASNGSSKSDFRYLEKYEFYLCSNELNAVTFHNLSASGKLDEICDDYDEATATIYRKAETLLSGAYTVSGFSIDTSLNPTVVYTVSRNGYSVTIPSNHQFTTSGKYVVSLKSAVGTRRDVTIYVDRMSTEEALKFYFGDSFITGKRIYSEGDYPKFEGGLTSYHLEPVDSGFLPLSGQIKNTSTGEFISILSNNTEKSGFITSPGIYEAVLSTNGSGASSGDNRTFTFRFEIIPEGTAPGPVINKQSLASYARSTLSDSYPVFYALTYPSASTGYITLAFGSKEAAHEFAYEYEKGMVERQPDGTYRYTGSILVAKKEKYDSAWDLTDAENYFAEQAIYLAYFDLSDEFSVLSLKDSVLDSTENPRTLELAKSVTIFAQGQKEALSDLASLPIISKKPYYYLVPGRSGVKDEGFYDFEFVKDKYGCDSYSVFITDCNGKQYEIEYNQGVGAQLSRHSCPSGVVTITEATVYGDSTTYQAVYISPNDNTAEIGLTLYTGSGETSKYYNQENDNAQVEAEAFSVSSLEDLLDPYCLVIITDGQNEYFFAADQIPNTVWADPGNYRIKVVNRLGYSFFLNVHVLESDYATIRFEGTGADSALDILTTYGAKNVKLPHLSRYGYELVGYSNSDGLLFSDEIAEITFRGSTILNAVWQAKKYTVTLQNMSGEAINTLVMEFGKEYELPVLNVDTGMAFKGWSLNGTLLDSNLITLETEGDLTLVAVTEADDTPQSGDTDTHERDRDGNSHAGLIISIVVIVVAVPVAIMVIRRTKKKHETDGVVQILEENNEENNRSED